MQEELGADVKDFDPGGGGPEGIGALLQSSSAGGVDFRSRDVGPDPPDGAVPGQLSAQGRAAAHREAAESAGVGELGISSAGGGNGGSGIRRYRGLCHEEAEYGCAIY